MRHGTRNRIMRLAKTIPVAMLTAIGLRKAACVLLSNNIGVSPSAVVEVVRNIARNRRRAASTTASVGVISVVRRNRLYLSTRTNESLITTPVSATMPNIDMKDML